MISVRDNALFSCHNRFRISNSNLDKGTIPTHLSFSRIYPLSLFFQAYHHVELPRVPELFASRGFLLFESIPPRRTPGAGIRAPEAPGRKQKYCAGCHLPCTVPQKRRNPPAMLQNKILPCRLVKDGEMLYNELVQCGVFPL